MSKTTLVSWESDLLDLVSAASGDSKVLAITRMDKSPDASGRWLTRSVDLMWLTNLDERDEVGQLVFQFDGELLQRDDMLQIVNSQVERAVIFNATVSGG